MTMSKTCSFGSSSLEQRSVMDNVGFVVPPLSVSLPLVLKADLIGAHDEDSPQRGLSATTHERQ